MDERRCVKCGYRIPHFQYPMVHCGEQEILIEIETEQYTYTVYVEA